MQLVSLSLFDNPIEDDPHYREHVIDIMPRLWSLDGQMITTAERRRVAECVLGLGKAGLGWAGWARVRCFAERRTAERRAAPLSGS